MSSCHEVPAGVAAVPRLVGQMTVALAGQPNVGKLTVFNMLTGLSQHVGNWPGKTIEQKVGTYRHDGTVMLIVDLPGTYSLTANSEEERIARDFIVRERPDVVVVIVNAAALERNLYLVAELLSLPQPVVLGLNMLDVAEQHGIHIEPNVLQAALGIPVVPLVATKNQGLAELMQQAEQLAAEPGAWAPNRPAIGPEHQPVLHRLQELIEDPATPCLSGYPNDWVALKLLEGDAEITAALQQALPPEVWGQVRELLLEHEDAFLDIAGGRYQWIGRMVRAAITRPRAGAISRTDQIDRLATHPAWGLMLLIGIFGVMFWLTYEVATPIVNWLSAGILAPLSMALAAWLAPAPALSGLLVRGVLGGVGTVLTFLPIMVIFFAILGTMEDVGYLARAAYVMDRFMHLMGLHGKSFLPLFLGFGCNVPAVLGTRIIDERRARVATIFLAPFVPCTARLAVLAFLVPAFFGAGVATLVTWGLVAANLLVLAFVGVFMSRTLFRGSQTAFIMEMPLYHIPNAWTVGLYVWNNTRSFVEKAGKVILIASIVVWALSSLPGGGIDTSILAHVGRWLEPAGRLLGLGDWRIIVAVLTSFVAKENVIATLGVLYAGGHEAGLAQLVAATLAPAARLALLVVMMLFIPCLATAATMRQELGSWRWTAFSLGMLLVISVGAGALVFQVGRLI